METDIMTPFTNITDKKNATKRREMTHFQDYLGEYTAAELELVFGEPVFKDSEGDFFNSDGKTKLEWLVKFDFEDPYGDWNGGYFHVYEYKNYRLDEFDLYGKRVMYHIGGKGLSHEAIHQFKEEFKAELDLRLGK